MVVKSLLRTLRVAYKDDTLQGHNDVAVTLEAEVSRPHAKRKRFPSAGLRDVIIVTELVGPDTVGLVLRGKHYNHGMRVIKTVSEAVFRLKLDMFKDWLDQKGKKKIATGISSLRDHDKVD
ncbi:hypothetical protein GQR58_025150 [Nymphon striatum]|nr:hypothetical protein GQR58_025150 [Nymphon striatum]